MTSVVSIESMVDEELQRDQIFGTPMLKNIEVTFETDDLNVWRKTFDRVNLNVYEGTALRRLFDELENLVDVRDRVQDLRDTFAISRQSGNEIPNEQQRRELYLRTKTYFDTYYGTLSHLSSVVARFSKVFERRAFSDNRPFVRWLVDRYPDLGPAHGAGLESARLFRTILNHPQQFPVSFWRTETEPMRLNTYLVIYGPESRAGRIPPGSTREGRLRLEMGDWEMAAPSEFSVTNNIASMSLLVLVDILSQRKRGASFYADPRRSADAIADLSPQRAETKWELYVRDHPYGPWSH